MGIRDNIVYDAYYLIHKFNENGRNVTNMQIQKLMYFFEAYYMNIYPDIDKLYECNFNAWAFGPVSVPLYKEFRKFGNGEIILNQKNIEVGNDIDEEKKSYLDQIYEVFKDISAYNLVELTHMEGSPWSMVWKKNGEKVGFGANTYIDKIESRDWFGRIFVKKGN